MFIKLNQNELENLSSYDALQQMTTDSIQVFTLSSASNAPVHPLSSYVMLYIKGGHLKKVFVDHKKY